MQSPIRGSCLCGAVTFEITGKIGPAGQCHCSKCRKVSGTDGNAVFYTAANSFRWLSGESEIRSFRVPGGNGWESSFCGTCGSPTPHTNSDAKIIKQEISELVERFYAKVRLDEEIGPIFNAIVGDWPHHLAKLKDFWSSAMLASGRYRGHPMMAHLQLPLDPIHFHRWLTLFAETANETLSPAHAAEIIEKSHRIAENFQAGIAYQRAMVAYTH